MPQLHIANTFFEHELASPQLTSLRTGLFSHSLYLQLQYLPFLYGKSDDGVLVTHPPSPHFLYDLESIGVDGPKKWHLLEEKIPSSYTCVESWGQSRSVASWAKQHQLAYTTPPWELTQLINSKAFSFTHGTRLPYATLLYTQEELSRWMHSFPGNKVLKTCYGLSGCGHFHLYCSSTKEYAQALAFSYSEWKQGRPILAEPWVDRVLDFSTQWYITSDGQVHYIGATICENDSFGRYRATRISSEMELFGDFFPFLEQHKIHVMEMLLAITKDGFFGNIGIDAMIYRYPDKHSSLSLQPIVEINARKTMGWVALEIHRRYFSHQSLRMTLEKTNPLFPSLLPQSIEQNNTKPLCFPKQLSLVATSC